MVYRGHVKNGRIELDEHVALPEGAEVQVNLSGHAVPEHEDDSIPTLYEQLKPTIGKVEELPADLSINHDHYLYGTPKRQ